jgi:hypothetical protein
VEVVLVELILLERRVAPILAVAAVVDIARQVAQVVQA